MTRIQLLIFIVISSALIIITLASINSNLALGALSLLVFVLLILLNILNKKHLALTQELMPKREYLAGNFNQTSENIEDFKFNENETEQAILSSIVLNIAVIDIKGNILYVNKSWNDFAKANGAISTKNVSVGSNYFEVCKKAILAGNADAEKAIIGIKSVFNSKKGHFVMEYPCNSPTELGWSMLNATNLEEEDEKVVIIHSDITARKLAEKAEKSIETRYRRLFESAKDGILIINVDTGAIEDVNPFLMEILDFPYNYFIGKRLWEIGIFKDEEASKAAFIELLEKEYVRYDDLPLKTKSGRQLNVEFVSNVYLVNDRKVIQCNIRDITDRKIAEVNLWNQNLELKKTNSELDRFVYSTSHDIRAPLTSLLGLILILDEKTEANDIEQKEVLKMMKQSVAKLDSFTEDIITYSRNSRMVLEMDDINFEKLINECHQNLHYMEADSALKFNVKVIQKGKFISDKRSILINLNNLISNAIKYQDKKKHNPYVNITVNSDTTKAIIVFEDNGIGIADEKQEKIFEMFYRATKLSKGSGLGLYIAKDAISKLKGNVTIQSKLNVGTTFTLTIPNQIEINK